MTVTLNLNIAPGAEAKVFTLQVLHTGGASSRTTTRSGITFIDEGSTFTVTFDTSSTSQTITVSVTDDDVARPWRIHLLRSDQFGRSPVRKSQRN